MQLPLPASYRLRDILEAIAREKDVGGFHLYNVGSLIVGDTVFPPCTPFGVQRTLESENIPILADILIVAAGHPKLITAPMVKSGAVVIDVGINRLPDGRIVGDVDFDEVSKKASYITKVPGGVGPMTVTMLLGNTVHAAEMALEHGANSREPAGAIR